MKLISRYFAFNGTKVYLQEDDTLYSGHGGEWVPHDAAKGARN